MRVLLTGAAGFIGARLAECLTSAYGAEVHALVRRLGTVGTARLARLSGIRIFTGDVRNPESVDRAATGCSHAIQCATATSENAREQVRTEREGIHHLLQAVRRHQLQRAVYLSSAAVHDPSRSGDCIREDSPLNGRSAYARTKIEAEAWLSRHGQGGGLPVVMLRPTAVWGPWSPNWTVAPAELIRKRVAFLPNDGLGTANTVYIDHLVDAAVLALTAPQAVGQAFLVNDDAPSTWAEFYGAYAKMLGVPLRYVADRPANAIWQVSGHNLGVLLRQVRRGQIRMGLPALRAAYAHVPAVKWAMLSLPEGITQRLKRYVAERSGAEEVPHPTASEAEKLFLPYDLIASSTQELYRSHVRYSNEKLKQLLGWKPRVPFEEAMARTGQWLAYAGDTA